MSIFDIFSKKSPKIEVPDDVLTALADGEMIDITTVSDETFATKVLGDGVAFKLDDGTVSAPCNGQITVLADTGHAFGMVRNDGVEVLVHIGIDTVELNGEGFKVLAKKDAHVTAGTPIVRANLGAIKQKGYDTTTMLIITDPGDKKIEFKDYGPVHTGDIITK